MPTYPGHTEFVESAAAQLGITDRTLVDQARRIAPLNALSNLVGQAYEATFRTRSGSSMPDVDLEVANRQAMILEIAMTAAYDILQKAYSDMGRQELNARPRPAIKRPGQAIKRT